MFIGRSVDGDRELLVLGLSTANRDRMERGDPIRISQKTHGLAVPANLTIMIFAGETEETMATQMRELIGPTTVVNQKEPR
jgi:hypothetical protein